MWLDKLNLRSDSASIKEIQQRVEGDASIGGANLVILMMAIVIASVGLNMNSTAVIIGAMLISPLMGGIVATGYGMATYDWHFVRQSLIKLSFQVSVALFASTLYFALTPLTTASSELLARTTPTFWDVIIALSGGIAGAIGNTRQEKSNVIPGVAIATALMPPLCTAGYGLAMRSWEFCLGALYLFFINAFFISLASFLIFKLLRIPAQATADEQQMRRQKLALWLLGLIITAPSLYTAASSVGANLTEAQARQFVAEEMDFHASSVVSYKILDNVLQIDVIGQPLSEEQMTKLQEKMSRFSRLSGLELSVVQGSNDNSLSAEQVQDIINKRMQNSSQKSDESYKALAAQYYPNYKQREADRAIISEMAKELPVLFPGAVSLQGGTLLLPEDKKQEAENAKKDAELAKKTADEKKPGTSKEVFAVYLTLKAPLTAEEQAKLQAWLNQRTGRQTLLYLQMLPAASPAPESAAQQMNP